MTKVITRIVGSLAIGLAACGTAGAASSPIGVWIDHTGRGAVEITDCGGKLCGRLVWFKEAKHSKEGCNFQIIGNVRPVAGNKWDGGWIIDPDKDPDKKYDVEITPLNDQKLKVMGYAGTKLFSETMTWTRAPADLKKCEEDVAKPAVEPPAAPGEEPPRREAERETEAPDTKRASEPEPDKPAKRDSARRPSKDCKVEYGGISLTLPCNVLE
jgi:uncharacterized protein (DUF2147 family)